MTFARPISRLRVVGGQIDRWAFLGEPHDGLHGPQRDRLAGADAIDSPVDERLLGVRRVARQEVADIAVHDDHRDVPRCVSRRRHDDDAAVRGDPLAAIEGSEGFRYEVDRPGLEPIRPSVRQVTPEPPGEPLRQPQLLVAHEDLAPGEVVQTARMVGVQVGKDHRPHVVGADAEFEQLRADLLLGSHIQPNRQPEVRVPAGKVARFVGSGGLARVHDDHTLSPSRSPRRRSGAIRSTSDRAGC